MKQLNNKELKGLAEILERFERDTLKENALHWVVGGFAIAEMFDYDDESIDIELKFGIQSDCQNTVTTEHWTLYRKLLKKFIKGKISLEQVLWNVE